MRKYENRKGKKEKEGSAVKERDIEKSCLAKICSFMVRVVWRCAALRSHPWLECVRRVTLATTQDFFLDPRLIINWDQPCTDRDNQ